jgi:hypothetical protein
MMTPKKATMADMSRGKRDPGSDHTDQPITTPNSCNTKLLCSVGKAAIGKEKDQELIEIDPTKFFNSSKYIYDTAVIRFAGSKVINVDKVNSLISSGGLEKHARESDMEEYVPYSLFDKFENMTNDSNNQDSPTGSPTGSPIAMKDHYKPANNSAENSNITNTNTRHLQRTKQTSNNKNTNNTKTCDDGKDATAVLILPKGRTKPHTKM